MPEKFELKSLKDLFVIFFTNPKSWIAAHSLAMTKKAFTLAEVLVTLGIIGIVAALTLPNLIANHQKKVLAAQAKTAYSLLSQAFVSAINNNGDSEYWQQNRSGKTIFQLYLFPELKGTSSFDNRDIYKNCREYLVKNDLWYSSFGIQNTGCFVLSNGMAVFPSLSDTNPTYYVSSVLIDVNGFKKPNKQGKDVHRFIIVSKTDGKWGGFDSYAFGGGGQIRPTPVTGIFPDGYGMSEYCNNADPRYGISMSKCTAKLMADGWEFKDDYPW